MSHPSLHDQLRARATELLGDGQWHNYEQLIRELGKLIPPGIAMREQEKQRRATNSRNPAWQAPAQRKRPRDADRMVETGRRSLVRIFLKNPAFEKDIPGHPNRRVPERQIRLTAPLHSNIRGGRCTADPAGHDDQLTYGPRGAPIYVCRRCGRVDRPSQHPERGR